MPQQVDTKIRTQHTSDVEHYESLNELLPRWRHAFADPTSVDTWQVYVPLDGTHWLAVIIGNDRTDSYNLISVFRIRDRNVRNSVKRALGNRAASFCPEGRFGGLLTRRGKPFSRHRNHRSTISLAVERARVRASKPIGPPKPTPVFSSHALSWWIEDGAWVIQPDGPRCVLRLQGAGSPARN